MPQLQIKFSVLAFSHAGSAACNSLPPDICAVVSPAVLKKLIEMRRFNIAFTTRAYILAH